MSDLQALFERIDRMIQPPMSQEDALDVLAEIAEYVDLSAQNIRADISHAANREEDR